MIQIVRRSSGLLLVIFLLAAWESSARLSPTPISSWPPFSTVVSVLFQDLLGGELLQLLASTARRMAVGFFVGSALGVGIGLAMGLSPKTHWTIGPFIELLRPIPAAAIIPPLIFIFGIDDRLKIFVVALASFFPVVVNTLAGVMSVEPTYFQVLRTFRIPRALAVRKVVLPSVMPYVFAGMRTSLAVSLITTVVAEMIAGHEGVGYYIVSMQYAMRPADMYAAVIALSIFGYSINRLFQLWEVRALHWTHS